MPFSFLASLERHGDVHFATVDFSIILADAIVEVFACHLSAIGRRDGGTNVYAAPHDVVILILAGAPIGFTLILIPFVYILFTDAAPMILIPSQMFSAIDSVPLTAIPFFMLTGELMTSATITDRLVELSKRIVGRMRGSMAQVNVRVSMFFAGMNGSVVADTATVGSLMVPGMKKAGYPPEFAAAITAVSSTIGGIIPPHRVVTASTLDVALDDDWTGPP